MSEDFRIQLWDAAELLTTPERRKAYLIEALKTGDSDLIKMCINAIERAERILDMPSDLRPDDLPRGE